MIRLSATQKAACEAILRAWLSRGEDARYLKLEYKSDLYAAKRAIEDYVSVVPDKWLSPIVALEVRAHGYFQGGFTTRWPAVKVLDEGFAAVPPVPLSLMQWDEDAQGQKVTM